MKIQPLIFFELRNLFNQGVRESILLDTNKSEILFHFMRRIGLICNPLLVNLDLFEDYFIKELFEANKESESVSIDQFYFTQKIYQFMSRDGTKYYKVSDPHVYI